VFHESQYKVVLSLPDGEDETYTFNRAASELAVVEGEYLDLGGGRHVVVTEIVEKPVPGKKIGLLTAKLPEGPHP
jgi:hypothetical protein